VEINPNNRPLIHCSSLELYNDLTKTEPVVVLSFLFGCWTTTRISISKNDHISEL
ncbi:unnamed protein product, partial [Amoebophrya sp. A120]